MSLQPQLDPRGRAAPHPPPQGIQLLAFHVIVTLGSPSPVSEDSTAVPAFPAGFQAHREVASACAQCVDTLPHPQQQLGLGRTADKLTAVLSSTKVPQKTVSMAVTGGGGVSVTVS